MVPTGTSPLARYKATLAAGLLVGVDPETLRATSGPGGHVRACWGPSGHAGGRRPRLARGRDPCCCHLPGLRARQPVWGVSGPFLQLPLLTPETFVPGAQFQAAWGSATSAASTPPTEARRAARWLPAGRRRAPSMAPRSGSHQGTRGPPAPLRAATAPATPTGASSPTGGNCPSALGGSLRGSGGPKGSG